MDERKIVCSDGSRWRVIAASRSSPHRIELVFESLDPPGSLLRGETAARGLEELAERELCFILEELRRLA